jgi:histidinol-phosphatase (PHP family)
MWLNFHTHSTYCDGNSTLDEIVEKAKLLKVRWLGFSSHAPLPFACSWSMNKNDFDEYLNKIITLKKSHRKTEIYSGLEVDYIPNITGPKDIAGSLDYTIGSIHFVESFKDGRKWEIDGPHSFFLEGLEKIFSNKIEDAVVRYFELTREMVERSAPSVVGHLDKIKIQNIDNKFFFEDDPWYHHQIETTLNSIKKSGSIIEVNTRGVYQKKTTTTYPSPWILELIHKKNIPITLSSDAHHCDDLINQFYQTAKTLKQIGFQEIHILHNGAWQPFKFDEHGVKNK